MDGTIVDSEALIVTALQTAFENAGEAPPDHKAIRSIIGLSLPIAIEALGVRGALVDEIVESYKTGYSYMRDQQGHPEPLFGGMLELIHELRAIDEVILGIATGKSMRGVTKLLERFDLSSHFHTIQTADNAPSKPHPGMIEQALVETGIDGSHAMMIGDTTFDMEMAQLAGIDAIGVSWGHHGVEEMQVFSPKLIVDEISELKIAIHDTIKKQQYKN